MFRFINPVALRRLTAKFARTHTQLLYPTSIPRFESPNPLSVDDLIRTKYPTFASSFRFDTASKLRTVVTEFKKRHSHSPRVALYSRGESGLGRTIAKENLLLEFLRHLGMETYYFCENCGTMELQIAVASIADIVCLDLIFIYS